MKILATLLLAVLAISSFGLTGCAGGGPMYGPHGMETQHDKQMDKQRQRQMHRNLR